jgi:hypothetical protein
VHLKGCKPWNAHFRTSKCVTHKQVHCVSLSTTPWSLIGKLQVSLTWNFVFRPRCFLGKSPRFSFVRPSGPQSRSECWLPSGSERGRAARSRSVHRLRLLLLRSCDKRFLDYLMTFHPLHRLYTAQWRDNEFGRMLMLSWPVLRLRMWYVSVLNFCYRIVIFILTEFPNSLHWRTCTWELVGRTWCHVKKYCTVAAYFVIYSVIFLYRPSSVGIVRLRTKGHGV